MRARFGWRRVALLFAGVRARSTAVAVCTVAAALVAGALLLYVLLQSALTSSIEDAARSRAGEVAVQLRTGDREALTDNLSSDNSQGQSVQVLNAKGAVVNASSRLIRHQALTTLRPKGDDTVLARVDALPPLDAGEPYVVAVRHAAHEDTPYTVIVAAPLEEQRQTVRTVFWYLLGGLPLLMLLVGSATWLLVGRALLPVERIRRRVHGITAARLTDRVPVPATRDEVARLAVTMNQMLDRLDGAQSTQRRFLADASHELRSPLSTVIVGLEVAEADPSGQAWRDLYPTMHTEAQRMSRLVQDLLLLATADDTGLRVEQDDVDLDDLVDAEARRLRLSTDLEVHTDAVPVRVRGDAAKLEQVIRNLATNASRAARSVVRLVVAEDEGMAIVAVEDDGDGVPMAERERVFERFVRLDASRERERGGSGLGLAIVAEVVRAHGGTVRIDDSSLGGARFEVRLPLEGDATQQPPRTRQR